ncbi:MAG: SLC13 family permease, partial [Luteimonas sp.]
MLGLPIELLLTVAVMLLAVYLFVTEKLRVDVVALLVMTSLLVLGIISVPEALSGFSNQATVMVAAMFVLSGALKANGALVAIGDLLSRIRWRWLFLLVMLALGVSTAAFINNTATVAVFLPLVLVAAAANGWAPSKFLIPLSYISQTAGVCTLIGTSTNLLVD